MDGWIRSAQTCWRLPPPRSLKAAPDIRLNRLANWTCLLAVAPIYVHSLLQLVHLHYWNGLSSGLDRVLEMVKGRGAYRRIMNNVENKHIWALDVAGRCCEMPGFRFLSHSSWDCMRSLCQWMLMLWILSLGALSNTHTHTHTCSSRRWALQPDRHPGCVLCHRHSGDTLLGVHSLFLIECCWDFTFSESQDLLHW